MSGRARFGSFLPPSATYGAPVAAAKPNDNVTPPLSTLPGTSGVAQTAANQINAIYTQDPNNPGPNTPSGTGSA